MLTAVYIVNTQAMQTLKQLAEDGHTVVCSIHQVCSKQAPRDVCVRNSWG